MQGLPLKLNQKDALWKRLNRKHKKLLQNETKPHALLEQDDMKEKQIDHESYKYDQNVILPTFCSDFTYKHFTPKTVIQNQCLSNECKPQNSITKNENGTKRKLTMQDIKSNPKVVISKENEDSICKMSDKIIIDNQCLSNEHKSQKLHVTKSASLGHACNIMNSENVYESKDINENPDAPVLNMSGVRPKHGWNVISEPIVYQTGNNFDEFFIHDSESDNENRPSNFYNSSDISRNAKECRNLQLNLFGVGLKNGGNAMSDTNVYQNENNFDDPESSVEYMTSNFYDSSAFSSDEHGNRNLQQQLNLERMKIRNEFYSSMNEYKHCKESFSCIYHKWLPERKSTLEKLRSLYDKVHEGQMKYIESQSSLKTISFNARSAKCHSQSQILGFFASAMSLIIDAASGASSFTQAYNIDWFQIKFQEVMDHDAEITKDLYEIRSRCVAKYEGIEEVMKKFHADTLSSTINKISDTLRVNKYWEAMKNAYKNDDMPKLMDEVGNFFNNACQSEVLGKVSNSIETYVYDNPAALEGCKSTSKAMYEAVNTCTPFYSRKGLNGEVDSSVDFRLMLEDREEAERLKNISKDYIQSKLESQIEDAIDLLESEMKEIIDTYFNLFES